MAFQVRDINRGSFGVTDRVSTLAKLFGEAFYNPLSAMASSDGVAAGMISLDNGNYRRFVYKGRLNTAKAAHALTVKNVIGRLFQGHEVDNEMLGQFRKAARAIDGTEIVQETLGSDFQTVLSSDAFKVEGMARAATALITAVELRALKLP